MVGKIITYSLKNRFIILIATIIIIFSSIWAMKNTPLDALPDLSPAQVIVQISWKGQSPNIIQEQATYPLVTQFLSIANIETVRGFSSYENGLIYIIFKEKTDLYWARSRVLEQLSSIQSKLPKGVNVSLGPDSSGVGWAYEYALKSDRYTLDELRSLQDYYFKYALMGVDGVSEVASVGGFVPTAEVVVNNGALVQYNISTQQIAKALKANNNETGGELVIKNGYEYIVHSRGYLKSLDEIKKIPLHSNVATELTISDVADVRWVSAPRRGLADLNGEGEVVGGIVMVRYKEDLYSTIKRVKKRLKELKVDGVDVVTVYDRTKLIEESVATLKRTLVDESLIVIVVIALFLMHLRSTLVMMIVLPLTIALPFLLMKIFGIGSNIMSLGGIAIAIGAMVDASIVMIENAHKSINKKVSKLNRDLDVKEHLETIEHSSILVGKPIFFALLLVVVSFLPIFALSNQEGLLFTPLAFTKSFAMGAGALLSVTLVPVLMSFFIKGRLPKESSNPINRLAIAAYGPILNFSFKLRYLLVLLCVALIGTGYYLYKKLDWEFMPTLDEMSIMYMPVTPYGISVDMAKSLTQKSDAIIKSFPEVKSVFGKAGRADSATDPAPLSMIETIITLKDGAKIDKDKLIKKLDKALDIPGLVNSWTYPIRGRIDMLISGIRTPLGIKIFGKDPKMLQQISTKIENTLRDMPQTESVSSDKSASGYYIQIDPRNDALRRYGVSKDRLLSFVSLGIGAATVSRYIKGLERYPITLRFASEQRDDLKHIESLMIKTPYGFVPIFELADVRYTQGPSVIKSEMATPVTNIYITPKRQISSVKYKQVAKDILKNIKLPSGYYMKWAGQSEYLESAMQKMRYIFPMVLLIIVVLIYLSLGEIVPTLMVFFTLPFALVGGMIYLYILDFDMSIAVIVGFLALLGIAAETAIVMIVYLKQSIEESRQRLKESFDLVALKEAIYDGAVQRVRPKLMTLFAILASLLPIMYIQGVGSEVMQRIAAPMIGGIVSSALLSLILIPVFYSIYEKRRML